MAGRKPKFKSPEQLRDLAEKYFAACEAKDEPRTITGLCLALEISRKGFYVYAKKPEFEEVVDWARTMVEHEYEKRLHGPNATGAIFGLKNFGWTDKQEIEHGGEVGIRRIERVIVDGNAPDTDSQGA